MRRELVQDMLAHAVAFDVETHKIQPGLLAPPLVCGSTAIWDASSGRSSGALLSADGARAEFRRVLRTPTAILCGANIAYDVLVMAHDAALRGEDLMPEVFGMYEAGRVWDLQVAEALHAVANGHLGLDPRRGMSKLRDPVTNKPSRYSLSVCLDLVLHRRDAKVNDRFRQSYALLEDTPIDQWPVEARVYPVDDACNTLDVCLAQAGLIPRPALHVWTDGSDAPCRVCGTELLRAGEVQCTARPWRSANTHDVSRQVYAALCMHLGAAWGFSVDAAAVEALRDKVTGNRAAAVKRFVRDGYLREEYDRERALAVLDARGISRRDCDLKCPQTDHAELLREGGAVKKVVKNQGAVKRAVALAYGATGACAACAGGGKVPSAKSGNPTSCRMCDSTGLNLDSAPVPRTKGSKCRTCSGRREFPVGKPKTKRDAATAPAPGTMVACAQCEGQPDVVPGCGIGRDALYESGDDDVLVPFAEYLLEAKILETYIPFLGRGITDDGEVEVDFDLQDETPDTGGEE